MPFIDGFERRGLEALRIKFGAEALELMPEIREFRDHKVLDKILARIEQAVSPDDLRRVWTRKRRPRTAKPM
jgi:hypothetical protein